MKHTIFYLSFILFFITLSSSVKAQDFDEDFLKSLPEEVQSDLMKRKSDKEELEEDRYRRPSSYIEKKNSRKKIEQLQKELDLLRGELLETEYDKLDIRFGSEIFSLMQTTLMPFNEPNFDGEYVLDYGDVLEIQLVGQKTDSHILPVKRDGSVSIPGVGKVFVSGLSLDNAVNTISKKIESFYTAVEAYTTLVSVRDIQVIIAGNAFSPGPYTLNGNSTLFHALAISGGPSEDGSFRQIDLVRGGKVIETADFYETFINGASSFSSRLRSGDLVFVRPVSNLVSISGAVKRPGTYELRPDENLSTVISFANGINNKADLSQISLIRISDGMVSNIPVKSLSEFNNMLSEDNDKLVIGSYSYRSVEIEGAVKNPGKYLINEGAGIYDLVIIAGGYTNTAYPFGGVLENNQTKKINEKAGQKLYESFIDELSNISSNVVPQQGEMSFLAELINEIKNTKPSGRVSAEFDLEKLKNDPSLDILLQDGDKIIIPEFLDHIYIFGEINTEGTIRYKEGADFKYYIDKKGGYSPYANKKNVYVLHPNGETTQVTDNKNIFMRQRKDNMILYPGSVIFIPRETAKVPFSVAAQAYASILGNIGVSLASVSVLKD
ncbi:MAG: SLBB domain-containing protein [Flavobacteriaceae bacterium]|nr:SLBB domain-containing protein [Flavobacteriaceae bacterium]